MQTSIDRLIYKGWSKIFRRAIHRSPNTYDDIDWDSLPNQFVLKCTHDSGGLVVCGDKLKFDKTAHTEI